jgi:opacity protein-like surface antigen
MKGMLKGVAALALSTALFASAAQAQTPVSFGLGGGVTLPLGDFGDAGKTGFHGMGLVEFQPASLPVGIRVDGSYHRVGFSDLQASGPLGDGNFQLIVGTVNGVYTFQTAAESKFHPYIIAGAGAYNFKANFEDFDDNSETKFGINAGAGFNMGMGSASIFLEGRFHNIFTEGSSTKFVPVTLGVRFGGGGTSM